MSVTQEGGSPSPSDVVQSQNEQFVLMVCSDSVGETATAVAKATLRQFEGKNVRIKRVGNIRNVQEVEQIVKEAKYEKSFIAYTFVQADLRETMKNAAIREGVRAVDIMGPMLQAFTETFYDAPKREPGLLHGLDDQYFKRVEAVEFAVKYDDGRDPSGIAQAEIVLIGVSRTSKTPLSMFLAHKGFKVANWPLVPEVKLPDELLSIPSDRIIGLTMSANAIHSIRAERLKSVGLPEGAKYASMERIDEELQFANDVMKRLGCRVIDVTDRSVEETAGLVMDLFV